MSDLQRQIAIIHGETEQTWEVSTALPTETEQGVILVQVPAETDPAAIRKLHEMIETMLDGTL